MRRTALIAATGIALAVGPHSASDAWAFSLRYKGFNYVSYYNGGYQNADSMSAMIGAGANAAALAFEYGIDVQNSAVYADVNYTDPLSVIAATIASMA